ncbi:MAG TPA: hypothetical protein VGU20_22670 [Stellaceae bacterium]|nr:hypothetical protein [Stellaceae bacterium]
MSSIAGRRGEARATSRKLAAWLAVVSLLLQLWITAGHFHPEDFASFLGATQAGDGVAASTDPGTKPAGALLHSECAICLSAQTAGSAALANAASPNGPTIISAAALEPAAALPRSRPAHLLFQTRAPPIA